MWKSNFLTCERDIKIVTCTGDSECAWCEIGRQKPNPMEQETKCKCHCHTHGDKVFGHSVIGCALVCHTPKEDPMNPKSHCCNAELTPFHCKGVPGSAAMCSKCHTLQELFQPTPKTEEWEKEFEIRFGDNIVWWRECLAEMRVGDADFTALKSFIRTLLAAERDKVAMYIAEGERKAERERIAREVKSMVSCFPLDRDAYIDTFISDILDFLKN